MYTRLSWSSHVSPENIFQGIKNVAQNFDTLKYSIYTLLEAAGIQFAQGISDNPTRLSRCCERFTCYSSSVVCFALVFIVKHLINVCYVSSTTPGTEDSKMDKTRCQFHKYISSFPYVLVF